MTWWAWMILGALLSLVSELFAVEAQFYLVFLGVSAALVGLAWTLFGIAASGVGAMAGIRDFVLAVFLFFSSALIYSEDSFAVAAKTYPESMSGESSQHY